MEVGDGKSKGGKRGREAGTEGRGEGSSLSEGAQKGVGWMDGWVDGWMDSVRAGGCGGKQQRDSCLRGVELVGKKPHDAGVHAYLDIPERPVGGSEYHSLCH